MIRKWLRQNVEHVSARRVIIEHTPGIRINWRESHQGDVLYIRASPEKVPEPKHVLKAGDPCPECGAALVAGGQCAFIHAIQKRKQKAV